VDFFAAALPPPPFVPVAPIPASSFSPTPIGTLGIGFAPPSPDGGGALAALAHAPRVEPPTGCNPFLAPPFPTFPLCDPGYDLY
jgi:hypothetical protein